MYADGIPISKGLKPQSFLAWYWTDLATNERFLVTVMRKRDMCKASYISTPDLSHTAYCFVFVTCRLQAVLRAVRHASRCAVLHAVLAVLSVQQYVLWLTVLPSPSPSPLRQFPRSSTPSSLSLYRHHRHGISWQRHRHHHYIAVTGMAFHGIASHDMPWSSLS